MTSTPANHSPGMWTETGGHTSPGKTESDERGRWLLKRERKQVQRGQPSGKSIAF